MQKQLCILALPGWVQSLICMRKDSGHGEVFEGIEGKYRLLPRPPPLVPLWGCVACPSRSWRKSNHFCRHGSGSSEVLSDQEQGCVAASQGQDQVWRWWSGSDTAQGPPSSEVGLGSSPDLGPGWSGGGPRPGTAAKAGAGGKSAA